MNRLGMTDNSNSPKNKIKTALLVSAIVFVMCSYKVVQSKVNWGDHPWNSWKFNIISGLIMAIAILVAMYWRYGRRK